MSNQLALDYARQIEQSLNSITAEMQNYTGEKQASLYKSPEAGEWSVIENLGHIVEFLPYWLKAMLPLIEKPGQPFGRTHTDPERIAAVANHAHDSLSETLARLETAHAEARAMLLTIEDKDWAKSGLHSRRGVMTLRDIMEAFVTQHILDHTAQYRAALQTVESAAVT